MVQDSVYQYVGKMTLIAEYDTSTFIIFELNTDLNDDFETECESFLI